MILKSLMKHWQTKTNFSSVSGEEISDKDYQHVFKILNKFETKTIKDYHDLCLKYDALLFADVFEKLTDA